LTKRADTGQWVLPGGYIECGETLEDGVKREVHEEIGVEVNIVGCSGVYSIANVEIICPAKQHIIVVAVVLNIVSGSPSISSEVKEVHYFNINDLPDNLVFSHIERIHDGHKRRTIALK
ncbi:MAG: NUDIX domain-containing protein, partial [Candidatus Omnitrophica bacterium]|nr:NUDIX domain-containing protein [Candidatus Omnitrophota bacterium]